MKPQKTVWEKDRMLVWSMDHEVVMRCTASIIAIVSTTFLFCGELYDCLDGGWQLDSCSERDFNDHICSKTIEVFMVVTDG